MWKTDNRITRFSKDLQNIFLYLNLFNLIMKRGERYKKIQLNLIDDSSSHKLYSEER